MKKIKKNLEIPGRWSKERAKKWYERQGWICGPNYIPSYAINTIEMWQKKDFNIAAIEKELILAESVGFNALRIFLHYLVWEDDPKYMKDSMEKIATVASNHKMRIAWVLFDDCVYPLNGDNFPNPKLGKQPDPIPGVYGQWVPNPGHYYISHEETWSKLKAYVVDVVSHFANDTRILFWDLYNEPQPRLSPKGNLIIPHIIEWVRELNPSQPITIGYYFLGASKTKYLNKILRNNVDIVTFHQYLPKPFFKFHLNRLLKQKRPVLSTEWMHRLLMSGVKPILPVLYKINVGGFHWGHVTGKTQTNLSWFNSKPGSKPPRKWQHDLFYRDFTPYDPEEIALFKKYLKKKELKNR